MISPRLDLKPRSDRPLRPHIPRWKRMLTPIAKAFVRRVRLRLANRTSAAGGLLQLATECVNREQLESLLGRPRYAMLGEKYGKISKSGQIWRPDIVEVYQCDECMVEIWFKDGVMISGNGLAIPNDWELLANA